MKDYCTLWPEGWWGDCCKQHDSDYLNQIGRAVADNDLFQCVMQSSPEVLTNHPMIAGGLSLVVAGVMFAGVRIFGSYFYKRSV